MSKDYYVYIISSFHNERVYTGSTNNMHRRLMEHFNQLIENSHTYRYKFSKLVYIEGPTDRITARERENEIKGWRREKKNNLINSQNPKWINLADDWGIPRLSEEERMEKRAMYRKLKEDKERFEREEFMKLRHMRDDEDLQGR